MCRLVEMTSGAFFFEKTTFNSLNKSVHSSAYMLKDEKFNRIVSGEKQLYNITYGHNIHIVSGNAYYREINDSKTIRSVIVDDQRPFSVVFSPMHYYLKWKINNYMKK